MKNFEPKTLSENPPELGAEALNNAAKKLHRTDVN
jgi:hypothetical protein